MTGACPKTGGALSVAATYTSRAGSRAWAAGVPSTWRRHTRAGGRMPWRARCRALPPSVRMATFPFFPGVADGGVGWRDLLLRRLRMPASALAQHLVQYAKFWDQNSDRIGEVEAVFADMTRAQFEARAHAHPERLLAQPARGAGGAPARAPARRDAALGARSGLLRGAAGIE
ncbi:unnamed protein product, partial [Prorocentrum cordatum]